MNVYDLNERVAVVTGGAQGIGVAVVNGILASGGRVAIWDRDRALLDERVKRDSVTTMSRCNQALRSANHRGERGGSSK
jgi:NAD(P)-dependent dehydrogenase (short-subunit alcohol dehydrogenase family)